MKDTSFKQESAIFKIEAINYQSTSLQLQEYQQIIGLSSTQDIDFKKVLEHLNDNKIRCNFHSFYQQMQLTIDQYSNNYQALRIQVRYGHYTTYISLLNIQKTNPFKHFDESFSGSFAKVYKYHFEKQTVAIKSFKIEQAKFDAIFGSALKEYFLLKIAGLLGIGPQIAPIFGFDFLAFRDSLVFCMEFCQGIKNISQKQYLTMKTQLKWLHQLQIVHCDIKPQNICFHSPSGNPVFIDYGLSSFVSEKRGTKTLTPFVGSMNFCSKQMLEVYMEQKAGFVDLLHNDAVCLKKSVQFIRKQDYRLLQESSEQQYAPFATERSFELEQILKISRGKQYLFAISTSFASYDDIQLKCKLAAQRIFPALLQFIKCLPQSYNLWTFCRNLSKFGLRNEEILYLCGQIQFSNRPNRPNHQQTQPTHDFFSIRTLEIASMAAKADYSNKIVCATDYKSLTSDNYTQTAINRLKFIRMAKIGGQSSTITQKFKACETLGPQIKNNLQTQQSTLRFYLLHVFKSSLQALTDTNNLEAFIESIQTVAFLELVSEQEFRQIFAKCSENHLDFINKTRILFQFLISVEGIRQKFIKKYNYEKLLQLFLIKIQQIASSYSPENEVQELILNNLRFILRIKKQGNRSLPQFFKDIRSISINGSERRLQRRLRCYIISSIIYLQLGSYSKYNLIDFELLICEANQLKDLPIYLESIFVSIAFKMGQEALFIRVYQRLAMKLECFKEFQNYRGFFLQKLNIVRKTIRSASKAIQKQFQDQQIEIKNQSDQIFSEVLIIVEKIILSNEKCCYFLSDYFRSLNILIHKGIYQSTLNLIYKYKDSLIKIPQLLGRQGKGIHQNHGKGDLTFISSIISIILSKVDYFNGEQQMFLHEIISSFKEGINRVKCFFCKIFSSLQLVQSIANLYSFKGMDKEGIDLMLDTYIFCLKNKQLHLQAFSILLSIIRRWRSGLSIRKQYDFMQIVYDYVVIFRKYHYLLIEFQQSNLFLDTYLLVAIQHGEEAIADLLINTVYLLSELQSNQLIEKFYSTVVYLVRLNQSYSESVQNFKAFSNRVMSILLSKKHLVQCHLMSLYLCAMLELGIKSSFEKQIIAGIAYLIKFTDRKSKSIIMSKYYHFFNIYIDSPYKKKKWLEKKQLKHSCVSGKLDRTYLKFVRKKLKGIGLSNSKVARCLKDKIMKPVIY